MAQAALQSNPGRMRRKEVHPLDGVTPFGDLVIRLAHALRALPTESKLKLLEDLGSHIARQYGELCRHQRARERRVVS